MSNVIKEAVSWFFAELNKQGINYAVLRKAELIPENIGNDIDILAAPGALERVKEIVGKCAEAHGLRIYERQNTGGYYPILYGFPEGELAFFRLDFTNRVPRPEELLAKREENGRGIYFIPEGLNRKKRKSRIKNLLTLPKRFLFPPGRFVVVLGPDGVGKSATAELAARILEAFHVPVSHMHLGFRPKILPTKKGMMSLGKEKPAGEESKVPGFFRFCYHTLDHFLGYWFVVRPALVKGRTVIGERYYYTYLVDPRPRKRYGVPHWLFRFAFLFMPKPELVALLSHDAESIHMRRQEHSVDEIARQIEEYRKLAMRAKRMLELKTEASLPEVAQSLAENLAPKRHRVAVVASHPIQYQSPLWREIAAHPEIDEEVLYCVNWGVSAPQHHKEFFNVGYRWDIPLLLGYKFKFLRNYSPNPRPKLGGFINPGIFWELFRKRYDAVIVMGWMDVTFWFAFLAGKLTGTPVLLRVVNSARYDRKVKRPKLLLALKRMYLWMLFRGFVSGFLSIGTWNREMYEEYGISPERIFHFPYAVWNEFFMRESERHAKDKDAIRRELGISANTKIITYAARFTEVKHPEQVISAYEKICSKYDVALLMIGDGTLLASVKKEVEEKKLPNVKFLGFKNQTELVRYYAVTDVFVRTDGYIKGDWGATVNEAMAAGLPIVAPDTIGAQVDLVRQGENGFTYPFGDIGALSECIIKVIKDARTLAAMKERSKEIISAWGYREDVEGLIEALEYLRRKNRR